MSNPHSKVLVGVDVSKGWMDVATEGSPRVERVDNEEAAITALLERVGRDRIALVVFEPTGGYERTLVRVLRDLGILFFRVHPTEVMHFRRRRGVKAKTDAIDARLLLAFAQAELPLRGVRPLVEGDEVLGELMTRRSQLQQQLHAERCRLAQACTPIVRRSIERAIDVLKADLDAIEAAAQTHVAERPELQQMCALLQSLKGVGPITAQTLLAELPQLGLVSGKEIASLVGLAPNDRQSGKRTARATTGHGNRAVRRVLFNAARCAIRHNAPLAAFYDRLTALNHRPGKVALVAVMRKMLVTLNAIAREKRPWRLQNA